MALNTTPNIDGIDDFYEELIELHRDRTNEQSQAINARLILLLANHIGDRAALSEAMRIAGSSGCASPGMPAAMIRRHPDSSPKGGSEIRPSCPA